jgi:hypothetical protein
VKTKPAEESSKTKGDAADGSTLLHMSFADSTPTAVEDSKEVQNTKSKLKPEPTDGFLTVNSNPAVSSSAEDSGPKNLWNEAYNALRKKNPKLIDAYEKDLLASQDQYQHGMLVRIRFHSSLSCYH